MTVRYDAEKREVTPLGHSTHTGHGPDPNMLLRDELTKLVSYSQAFSFRTKSRSRTNRAIEFSKSSRSFQNERRV